MKCRNFYDIEFSQKATTRLCFPLFKKKNCIPYLFYLFCSLFFFLQHADVHATACWRIGSYAPAGTLGQEKRYMHINAHTLTHVYMRAGGEREHIHISGDWFITNLQEAPWVDAKRNKVLLVSVQTGHVDIEEFRCGRKWESSCW